MLKYAVVAEYIPCFQLKTQIPLQHNWDPPTSIIQSSPIRPQLPSEQSHNNCPISPTTSPRLQINVIHVSPPRALSHYPSRGTRKVEVNGTQVEWARALVMANVERWGSEMGPWATRSAYSEGIDSWGYVFFFICCCCTILGEGKWKWKLCKFWKWWFIMSD